MIIQWIIVGSIMGTMFLVFFICLLSQRKKIEQLTNPTDDGKEEKNDLEE
jgi:hypothetical protein